MAQLKETTTFTLIGEEEIATHKKVVDKLGKNRWATWVKAKERELVCDEIDTTNEDIAKDLHILGE